MAAKIQIDIDKGSVDAELRKTASEVTNVGKAADGATKGADNLGRKMSEAGRSGKDASDRLTSAAVKSQFAWQQLAFAVDDFASVLANGGDLGMAIRAASNNISSLLTLFNPLLGVTAALALNGASLAARFVDWNDVLGKVETSLKSASPALADFVGQIKEMVAATDGDNLEKFQKFVEFNERIQGILEKINPQKLFPEVDTIEEVNAKLAEYQKIIEGLGQNADERLIDRFTKEIEVLVKRRDDLQGDADKNREKLADAIHDVEKDIADVRGEANADHLEFLGEVENRMQAIRDDLQQQLDAGQKADEGRLRALQEELELLRERGQELRRQEDEREAAEQRRAEKDVKDSGLVDKVIGSITPDDIARNAGEIARKRRSEQIDREIAAAEADGDASKASRIRARRGSDERRAFGDAFRQTRRGQLNEDDVSAAADRAVQEALETARTQGQLGTTTFRTLEKLTGEHIETRRHMDILLEKTQQLEQRLRSQSARKSKWHDQRVALGIQ